MTLYLADVGIVNALGSGKHEVLQRCLANDLSGMVAYGPLLTGRSTLVGAVQSPLPDLPASLAPFDCRNNRLLAAALDQLAGTLDELRGSVSDAKLAVVIGTSTSGIAAGEDAAEALSRFGRTPEGYHYQQQEIGTAAEFAARYLNLSGPRYTISTACSSSAKALASAVRLLKAGRCEAAVVGGVDSLCRLTLNGFDSLESIASDRCNPFSLNRRGINIGEGACVFVVSRSPAAIRLCGIGESSDAYHMSAPDPEGKGAELAIRAALSEAGVRPNDIGYINLHGTGTAKNDEMESRLVARIFGSNTCCGSTKPLLGHTLGAAGAQEAGLCWLLLSDWNSSRGLPSHYWDCVKDPKLPDINLIGSNVCWQRDVFVSNSFAFGGSNASVVLARA